MTSKEQAAWTHPSPSGTHTHAHTPPKMDVLASSLTTLGNAITELEKLESQLHTFVVVESELFEVAPLPLGTLLDGNLCTVLNSYTSRCLDLHGRLEATLL